MAASPETETEAAAAAAAAAAVGRIEKAHQMYREGRHSEALGLYSEALAMARTKAQRIALHSNRAACYLKLHDFRKAAEECTSVLDLDREHTGALMLRAQTFVTLKDYQSALFDVNRLMEINPSSEVYQNLQARLKTQLSLAPIPESEEESLYLEEDKEESPTKGNKKIETPIIKPGKSTTQAPNIEASAPVDGNKKIETPITKFDKPTTQAPKAEVSANMPPKPKGWEAIPKPKGHSGLDYSRWDKVEDDSSEEEEDDEEEQQPQYKFRVSTIGVRSVK